MTTLNQMLEKIKNNYHLLPEDVVGMSEKELFDSYSWDSTTEIGRFFLAAYCATRLESLGVEIPCKTEYSYSEDSYHSGGYLPDTSFDTLDYWDFNPFRSFNSELQRINNPDLNVEQMDSAIYVLQNNLSLMSKEDFLKVVSFFNYKHEQLSYEESEIINTYSTISLSLEINGRHVGEFKQYFTSWSGGNTYWDEFGEIL